MTGDRIVMLELSGVKVFFDEGSTIQFYKDEELILQMDPAELSILYGAYRQMEREQIEDEKVRKP